MYIRCVLHSLDQSQTTWLLDNEKKRNHSFPTKQNTKILLFPNKMQMMLGQFEVNTECSCNLRHKESVEIMYNYGEHNVIMRRITG